MWSTLVECNVTPRWFEHKREVTQVCAYWLDSERGENIWEMLDWHIGSITFEKVFKRHIINVFKLKDYIAK